MMMDDVGRTIHELYENPFLLKGSCLHGVQKKQMPVG